MSIALWIICNCVTLACFTWLAVATNHWWIVLLAVLFKCNLTMYKDEDVVKSIFWHDDDVSEEDTPREIAEHRNCTVAETLDPVTGEVLIRWHKQTNTESEIYIDRKEYEKIAHGE